VADIKAVMEGAAGVVMMQAVSFTDLNKAAKEATKR